MGVPIAIEALSGTRRLASAPKSIGGRAVAEKKLNTGPLRKWQDKRRAKRERVGPSSEAQQERRNADKVVDRTAVAKNAGKMFP